MEKIQKEINAEVELKASGGGVFEVTADGKLIYSKRNTGQFPNESDLIAQLKKR